MYDDTLHCIPWISCDWNEACVACHVIVMRVMRLVLRVCTKDTLHALSWISCDENKACVACHVYE